MEPAVALLDPLALRCVIILLWDMSTEEKGGEYYLPKPNSINGACYTAVVSISFLTGFSYHINMVLYLGTQKDYITD
jgi:hypothetical protein